jgi:DNA transposition AAA+ family ATPase
MPDDVEPPERSVVDDVVRIQEAESLSNRQVARILDCSPAVWSQIRAGKYAGDTAKHLDRARRWLEERAARKEAVVLPYADTSIGRAIVAVCDRAWKLPCIGRVITESGAGKSAALSEFARRRGGKVLLLHSGDIITDKRALLADLARRLGVVRRARDTAYDRALAVRDHIARAYQGGKGARLLVLVDEATVLASSALNLLRGFHDDPDCRIGVVLADTARLDVYIRSPYGIVGGNEQLRSRCGAAYTHRKDEEKDEWISMDDVRAVAGIILAGMKADPNRLDDEAWKYLHRLAQKDGRLRNVFYRLAAVRDVAKSVGAKPTYSARELDFAATLVGDRCELEHREPPFSIRAPKGAAARVA